MKELIEMYHKRFEAGYHNQAAYLIADYLGLKMKVKYHKYGYHFEGDDRERYIFKITLKKDGKQYTFDFGQSIAEGTNEPILYDVLMRLLKYDVGSFEDFCGHFRYDVDSRAAEKIYKSLHKEYENMQRLFTENELELLNEIQ